MRVSPSAASAARGGGLRRAWHALGGQHHRVLVRGTHDATEDGDKAIKDGDGAGLDGQAPDLALHRAEIDQGTGMLAVQLDVPAAAAVARLRAYAYCQDRRLADVAGDIVAWRLRLHRDPGQDGGP